MTGRSVPVELAGLSGVPVRLYRASPSRLATWLDCPRRYRLSYLDRPRPQPRPQRAHTTIGVVTHGVLRDFWSLPPTHRTPDSVVDLVHHSWVDAGFRDAAQSSRWRDRVVAQVIEYLRGIRRDRDPVGVERTVGFRTSTLAFSGRVDRIDEQDGALVVVDYKTSRRVPEPDDARTSLALGLYAHAVEQMFRRPCAGVELHHVPSTEVVRHEPTVASVGRKLAEAESIAQDLRRVDHAFTQQGGAPELFPARVGPLCRWCDLRAHCADGQAAGPEHSSWAGLDGESD